MDHRENLEVRFMSLFKNIITLGASGRIERKTEEFEKLRSQYESLYQDMEKKRKVVNVILKKLIRVKIKAVKSLSKIKKISKNIKSKDRKFIYRNIGNESQTINFSRI